MCLLFSEDEICEFMLLLSFDTADIYSVNWISKLCGCCVSEETCSGVSSLNVEFVRSSVGFP